MIKILYVYVGTKRFISRLYDILNDPWEELNSMAKEDK